jgi:hypothetical protein
MPSLVEIPLAVSDISGLKFKNEKISMEMDIYRE